MIQRRVDDSVSFDRDWDDYVNGFGDITGNYWAGLEKIHEMTTAQPMTLIVDVETFGGEPFSMVYETFSVGDAASNYKLTVTGFSTSSNRLKGDLFVTEHNGAMFSTRDKDHDTAQINCALKSSLSGGWWYGDCGGLFLNGDYLGNIQPSSRQIGILVQYIDTYGTAFTTKPVKSVEMRLRPRRLAEQ